MEPQQTSRPRDRLFYSLPDDDRTSKIGVSKTVNTDKLLNFISDNIIGKDKVFSGPFGLRQGRSAVTW